MYSAHCSVASESLIEPVYSLCVLNGEASQRTCVIEGYCTHGIPVKPSLESRNLLAMPSDYDHSIS